MHLVVTLVERDFLYGACVLYNSLCRNGFEGKFIIGYRGPSSLPLRPFRALQGINGSVRFIELDTPMHFTNYKPTFMQEVLLLYPDATRISYIDPDIVVNCPFYWLESWCDGGPAVCSDVNWFMPAQHPTRRQWLELSAMEPHHKFELYFNGGFVGLRRDDAGFLELWRNIIDRWGKYDNSLNTQGDIAEWRKEGRWLPFMALDQDALNLALMVWRGPVTTLGPDVMGFAGFGELPHAIGSNKPWRRKYLVEALRGKRVRHVDKIFWNYAGRPLQALPWFLIKLRIIEMRISSFIGRFYGQ